MSQASSIRRRIAGTLARIKMSRLLAYEARMKRAKDAPPPAEPEQPARPDIYRKALPGEQAYPPRVHGDTPADVVDTIKTKAAARRERRDAKRLRDFGRV